MSIISEIVSKYWIPLLFIILSLPLILEKVPPNRVYGLRTRRTFSDRNLWYRANKLSGWYVLIGGMVLLVYRFLGIHIAGLSFKGAVFIVVVIALAASLIHISRIGEPEQKMNIKKNMMLLLLLFVPAAILSAQPAKQRIAVLDFRLTSRMDKNEAQTLANYFRSKLSKTGKFRIMSRGEMQEILVEQDFNEACTSAECAVAAGKLLSTQKIVIGDIGKIGNTYTIVIKLIDVNTAEIMKIEEDTYTGPREGMLQMVDVLARKIAGTYKEKSNFWWYVGGGVVAAAGTAAAILLKKEPVQTSKGLPLPPEPPK